MEIVKLKYQDILVVDPGYIKSVTTKYNGKKELRFDALKLLEVEHEGDDGVFPVQTPTGTAWLGVDSGRIWKLQAEFDCEVEIDSGLSGHIITRKGGGSND